MKKLNTQLTKVRSKKFELSTEFSLSYYLHCEPSKAPCCSNILVMDRLLLSTATSKAERPSVLMLNIERKLNNYVNG